MSEFSDENKMDSENLAICFSPTLWFEKTPQQMQLDPTQLEDLVYARQSEAIRLFGYLIHYYKHVFGVAEDESGTDDVPGPLYRKSLGLPVEQLELDALELVVPDADDQQTPSTPTLRSQPAFAQGAVPAAAALTPTLAHVLRSQSTASQLQRDQKVRSRPSSQNEEANGAPGGGLVPRADPLLVSSREQMRERERDREPTKRRSANESLAAAELSLAAQQQPSASRSPFTATAAAQYAPCKQPAMSEKRVPPPTSTLFVQNPNTAPGRIELSGAYSPNSNSEHIKSLESLNASLRNCSGTLPMNANSKRSSKELAADQLLPMRERAPSDSRPPSLRPFARSPLGASLPQATTSPQLISISSTSIPPPLAQPVAPPIVSPVMVPPIALAARDPVKEMQPPSPSPMQQLRTSTENLLNELAEAVKSGGTCSPGNSPRIARLQLHMQLAKAGQSASLTRSAMAATGTGGRKLVSSGSFRESRTSTVGARMVPIASDDASVPSPTTPSQPIAGAANPESTVASLGAANSSGAQLSTPKTTPLTSRKLPAGVAPKPFPK